MAGIEDIVRVRFGWAANPTQSLAGVTWTDETARVRRLVINRGRSKWPGAWPAGTASIVLANTTGTLDLSDATYGSRLKSGRAVTVEGKDSGGTWRPLFTGHVRPRGGYEPHDTVNDSTLTVAAVDLMGSFSDVAFSGCTPASGDAAGYFSAALAAAGYSSVDDAIDTGLSVLDTAAQTSTGTLDAFLRQVEASEGGDLYCLKDGTLNLDDRSAVATVARLNTSQSTISDDSAAGTIAVLVNPGVRRTWGDRLATTVTATDYLGGEQSATATGDIGYAAGSYAVGRTFAVPAHAEAVAQFWVAQTSQIDSWPLSASILVAGPHSVVDTDHQNFACNRELRDFVTFEHTVPGLSQEVHTVSIESIRHDIDANGWRMALTFQSRDHITATGVSSWLILDDASKGQLDQESLGY